MEGAHVTELKYKSSQGATVLEAEGGKNIRYKEVRNQRPLHTLLSLGDELQIEHFPLHISLAPPSSVSHTRTSLPTFCLLSLIHPS